MTRNITHDLRCLSAAIVPSDNHSAGDLVIDLWGGPSNACGSVRFTFDSADELEERHQLVRSWIAGDVSVALVTDDSQIVLIDEQRLAEQEEADA